MLSFVKENKKLVAPSIPNHMFTFLNMFLIWTLGLLVTFATLRIAYRLFIVRSVNPNNGQAVSIMIVLGSGGHTTEMMKLIQSLNWDHFKPVHFVLGSGDTMSYEKIPSEIRSKLCKVHYIKRSRQVGQSYPASIISTLIATWDSISLVRKCNPQVLVCNGPGTCVPVSICAKIMSKCVIVYVESFCRVVNVSLSGFILYYIVDHFIVQWPQLKSKYPRSRYLGLLI